MISVVVVDGSAESRSRLVERITSLHTEALSTNALCPPIDIRPLSLHELSFAHTPDICIVGRECLERDLTEAALVKKAIPRVPLIAELSPALHSLVIAEQLARLGFSDVLSPSASGEEFIRRLLFLLKGAEKPSGGKLTLVDSGKGGLGVTSLVAAFGEMTAAEGKSVVIVDLDSHTQDLSRFIMAQPFINENLHELLRSERPILKENVRECAAPAWGEEETVWVVTAPPDLPGFYAPGTKEIRNMLAFLESLNAQFDYVIVDLAGSRNALATALLKVADQVAYVVSNDPACLFQTAHDIRRILGLGVQPHELMLVENNTHRGGLSSSFLRGELCRALTLPEDRWIPTTVSFCKGASRWPASGGTMLSQGSREMQNALRIVGEALSLVSPREKRGSERVSTALEPLRAMIATSGRTLARLPLMLRRRSPQVHGDALGALPDKEKALPLSAAAEIKSLPAPDTAPRANEFISELKIVNN